MFENMIAYRQLAWLKEFLNGLCVTDADHESVREIVDTFRAFFVVLDASKKMINKTPSNYSANSRKGKLQEALKPFMPAAVEPYDGPPQERLIP